MPIYEVGDKVRHVETHEPATVRSIQVDPITGSVFYRIEIHPETPDRIFDTVAEKAIYKPVVLPTPTEHDGYVVADWSGSTYPAKISSYRWNGWAVPRFTKEIAEKIVAEIQADADEYPDNDVLSWEGDRIKIVSPVYSAEDPAYEPEYVDPDADGMYGVGAMSWTWWETKRDYHEDDDAGAYKPMSCHDCGRPAYYDYADESYHHATDAGRPCFLIEAEDRADDLSHPLVKADR
jgi:hypothetical protein